MAITAPVHADVLPVGPSIDDPDNFDAEADTFVAAQRPFGIQMNALSDNVYANALAVKDLADSATASAGAASTSAGQANVSKNSAVQAAQDAASSAQAAADSATAAAVSSTGTTANSTSSVVMGNGTKTFTVAAGKQFPVAMPISATSQGVPANRMFGTVASYIGTTLTIAVTTTEGSGTYADWTLAPGGARGPAGGMSGGQLTGALDELKGSAPASSATPDVWGAGGNYVPITQTAAITGLPNAPQPGATRTLKAESTFPITSSTNFFVHGGSTVINPGDELDIVADTVSKFLVTVRRNNGAGSGAVGRVARRYIASTVWSPQVTGWHTIMLVGAAGSGACALGVSGARAAASGASTGGIVLKTYYATVGETYTLNLGSRGASVSISTSVTSNTALNGNDAADSTFVGGSVSLLAGGGKKGNATVGTTNTTVAAGAVGGAASGGDYNFPGSPSGTVTLTLTAGSVGLSGASGGAAPPYGGTPNKSGDVQITSPGSGGNYGASGGAGVGGKSGDVVNVNSGTMASGGASAYSPSANPTSGVIGTAPALDTDFSSVLMSMPLNLTGAGSDAQTNGTTANTVSGGGSGAGIAGSGTVTAGSGTAAMLGGTGGVAGQSTSSGSVLTSGSCTYGGASGGVAMGSVSIIGVTLTSGNAGQAFAIIVSP